jgi:hypothetical protein
MESKSMFRELKSDLPASIVVFFVAVPLCLGIALASGAPLFAGIIAGIVGGIIVGIASGSALGVSGPAAGLANNGFCQSRLYSLLLSVLCYQGHAHWHRIADNYQANTPCFRI